MSDKFYETAQLAFKRLAPKRGDIIIVSFPPDMAIEQIHATVTYFQQMADEFNCPVICASQGITMEVQTREMMHALGWYHEDDINKERTLN